MKAGRKRKPGPRYASGDRVKTVRQEETRRTALEARMRIFGVSLEMAGRDVMGSPLGRLLNWNIITPAQADAGYDFALTLRDYLAASGGQRPSQGKAGFLPALGGSGDCDMPVGIQERARTYMEALREVDCLDPTSPSATSIVWDVCISENDRMRDKELGLLRSGLNAISRVHHRGIVSRTR
ncbi:hypothetical protein [Taklimakanibacter albus]|uniref:Uncharacterized protein n=1 Tax=Taklimakanibacter albus TaxID=2800327 RepID=A0ACC5RBV1_9HYPH|nr:hypothetical protein [Aestuariivirga sp. YIM B02566]MBK1870093.1 hypothetical protein [Aestuariivirga sp. YIM B02566]